MSLESNLQTKIIAYLKSQGAVVDNIHGSEYQASVSDLLICYRGRYIALEAKGPDGSIRPGQRRRLRKVQKAGGIGEMVYGLEKVKEILRSINEGQEWHNTTY